MSNQTESSKQPNFRIYDRTGGGVTKDIYAESVEDAIEEGREWIVGGEWGDFQGTLDCCIREIVRYPLTPSEGQTEDEDGDILDAEGYIVCAKSDRGEIDEDATSDGQSYDCSAEITAEEPDCAESDDDEHDWQSPYEIVGGVRENPGVWGSGHGQVKITVVCAKCGMYRTTDYGATQSDNGRQMTRVTYTEADEQSRDWIAANPAE